MHSLSSNHSSDLMLTCLLNYSNQSANWRKKSVFPANAEGSDSDLKKLSGDGYKLPNQWQLRGWGRKGGSQRRNWEWRWRTKEGIGNSLAQDEIRNVWIQHYNVEIALVLCLTKDLKDYLKLLFRHYSLLQEKGTNFRKKIR